MIGAPTRRGCIRNISLGWSLTAAIELWIGPDGTLWRRILANWSRLAFHEVLLVGGPGVVRFWRSNKSLFAAISGRYAVSNAANRDIGHDSSRKSRWSRFTASGWFDDVSIMVTKRFDERRC